MKATKGILSLLILASFCCQASVAQYTAPAPGGSDAEVVRDLGWKPDPQAVKLVAESIPREYYQQVARLAQDSDQKTALLYRFLARELGVERLDPRDQDGVGSCVGWGTAHAIDLLSGSQIQHLRARERFVPANAAAVYAIGRQHANQLGRWDGSTGAWSIAGLREVGVLFQMPYGSHDLSAERPSDARDWANNGLPTGLLDEAGAHKVLAAVLLRDTTHLRGAIQNGYPAIICSNVGFENGRGSGASTQRDELGFAQAAGQWNHCMCVCAYRGPDTGREGFLIWNSWAPTFVRGPPWPEDMPHGSFWCDVETMERIIQQRDSWAIASLEGFKRRELSWSEAIQRSGGTRTDSNDE